VCCSTSPFHTSAPKDTTSCPAVPSARDHTGGKRILTARNVRWAPFATAWEAQSAVHLLARPQHRRRWPRGLRRTESTDVCLDQGFTVFPCPFPVDFLRFAFCSGLVARKRSPQGWGSKSDEAAKRCRRVGRRSLGQGCPRCQASYFTSLFIPELCPLPSFSEAPCSPFPGRACFAGPHTRGIVTWVLESADGWLPPVMPAGTLVQPVGRAIVEFYFCMGGFWRWCTCFKLNLAWLFLHRGRARRRVCC